MINQSGQNKAVVQRFYEELWNRRNVDVADEIFASNCVTHQLHSGDEVSVAPRNPDSVKHHVADWLAGFPDLRFTVEQMIAEDHLVVSQSVMHGTHTGNWMGIPATGKAVSIRMMVIHRIADRKIVEDWVLVEALGFFQQLGLASSTEKILSGVKPDLRS